MSLDTKYRPIKYADVLGQESTVEILRQYVATNAGFHQSYLFAGPWGSGKTTLGRILARALLCEAPRAGEPCDECSSCRSFILGGTSENFFEVDAATNSGKDSVRKIVDEIQYSTFSGRRRLYLIDESHRLSTEALDALLKPLEDNFPGSDDKLLVCIFCTTEPERMRTTILSRCAPAFVVKPVVPDQIGGRLEQVCRAEGIPYDREALNLIGELTECHIRDALKAVEGVSMLGAVDRANVARYLHLDYAEAVVKVLSSLGGDLSGAMSEAAGLLKTMSPITAYERLADMAMLAYRTTLGPTPIPSYLPRELVEGLGKEAGDRLLYYVERFSSRPGRPTAAMVMCDLAAAARGPASWGPAVTVAPPPPKAPAAAAGEKAPEAAPGLVDEVYVHPKAVKAAASPSTPPPVRPPSAVAGNPLEFFKLVAARVSELSDPAK